MKKIYEENILKEIEKGILNAQYDQVAKKFVGIFHARELVSLEKNIDNLILLLSFYGLPEHLMDDEEAKKVAKEILALDTNNKEALAVLDEFQNLKK